MILSFDRQAELQETVASQILMNRQNSRQSARFSTYKISSLLNEAFQKRRAAKNLTSSEMPQLGHEPLNYINGGPKVPQAYAADVDVDSDHNLDKDVQHVEMRDILFKK